jgi:pimeloyl-ACP methyl ester carboxylesterase
LRLEWQTVPRPQLARGTSAVDVHTAVWDGPDEGPVFVGVHGLGGSHVNWSLLAPLLAQRGEVSAPDLAGFGLTPPTGRRPTVSDNVDLLAGYIRTVAAGRPVILLGNSMGGLISILLAASDPQLVAGLVLLAPASPRPVRAPLDRQVLTNFALMAVPGIGERVLALRQRRTTPAQQVRETMRLCAADPAALDPAVITAHVEMATSRREMPYARDAMLQAARSLLLLVGPRAPVLWSAVADVQAPTLLLHGGRDRLVTQAGMRALAARRPDWTHITYDDLGHVPMLEAPHRVADDIQQWLASEVTVAAPR